MNSPQQPSRYEVEERFHDQHAGESNEFWEFTRPMFAAPEACLQAHLGLGAGRELDVLEIGCGDGRSALELLRLGAKLTAIDISGGQVEVAAKRIAAAGLSSRATFRRLEAEQIDYDGEFDVIVGKSILHHLDFREAAPKIARALRPGGVALFLEPLAHNPLLNLGRRATPGMRTPTEAPLSLGDIALIASSFDRAASDDFHLLSLASFGWYYVIKNAAAFTASVRALERIDRVLFALVPFLRRYAWITVVRFHKAGDTVNVRTASVG